MRGLLSISSAMIAATLSGGAWALTERQCSEANTMEPHGGEGGYENLGNKLVLYFVSFSYEENVGETLFLTRCSTGETLSGKYRVKWNAQGNPTSSLSGEQMRQIVVDLVKAKETYSFDDLGQALETQGYSTDFEVQTQEVCACKLFYPNQRRGKEPFVLPDWVN